MLRIVPPLVLVMLMGCKASDQQKDEPPPPPPGPDPAAVALEGHDDTEDDQDREQPMVAADPLSLETGFDGALELVGTGLPAIRGDGARIVRAENRFVAPRKDAEAGTEDARRIALRFYDVARGGVARETVLYDPARTRRPPAREKLQARVADANRALARHPWRSMLEPVDVLSDGWIKCRKGVQSFSIADLTISYGEPKLVVRRGDDVLFEASETAWVARPREATCQSRGYIADAAVDLETGALWFELEYCGECNLEPRAFVVRMPAAPANDRPDGPPGDPPGAEAP